MLSAAFITVWCLLSGFGQTGAKRQTARSGQCGSVPSPTLLRPELPGQVLQLTRWLFIGLKVHWWTGVWYRSKFSVLVDHFTVLIFVSISGRKCFQVGGWRELWCGLLLLSLFTVVLCYPPSFLCCYSLVTLIFGTYITLRLASAVKPQLNKQSGLLSLFSSQAKGDFSTNLRTASNWNVFSLRCQKPLWKASKRRWI